MFEKLTKVNPLILQMWMLGAGITGLGIGCLLNNISKPIAIGILIVGILLHLRAMYVIYVSKENKKTPMIERPKYVCPNCWGYYEYADKIRKDIYEEEIAVSNHEKVRSFVVDWVKKNLEGVHLKKEKDELVCTHCHTRYSNMNQPNF